MADAFSCGRDNAFAPSRVIKELLRQGNHARAKGAQHGRESLGDTVQAFHLYKCIVAGEAYDEVYWRVCAAEDNPAECCLTILRIRITICRISDDNLAKLPTRLDLAKEAASFILFTASLTSALSQINAT
jgi:hypothetical protein